MKKHRYLMISIISITAIHLLVCLFSTKLAAHFNMAGTLGTFKNTLSVLRMLFTFYIVGCGYVALREGFKQLLPLYLMFFFFNLVLPYLFAI